jgi:hypothetical protein
MRYINKIEFGTSCPERIRLRKNYEFIGTYNYIFTVVDTDTFEEHKYNSTELERQEDYTEILGVFIDGDFCFYESWSQQMIYFKNLFYYVEDLRLDFIPEIYRKRTEYVGRAYTDMLSSEFIIFDEIIGKNCSYEDNYNYMQQECRRILLDYGECSNQDFVNYTDFYFNHILVCRVQKKCIFQNVKSGIIYISIFGDIYLKCQTVIKHYKIKNVKNFNSNLAKIMLLS